ncbi:hypothetical protein H4R34_001201 [Dimargaris verticillata]|uniref:Methyltransferase-domain-containing protein n=1 Tax=Dimargaris verticillata TaxID=2761393 RepID=A0A9W8B6M7_9FUNG|nr:hypothetical protein H4R34_001201 [Dimargaris verticillata]
MAHHLLSHPSMARFPPLPVQFFDDAQALAELSGDRPETVCSAAHGSGNNHSQGDEESDSFCAQPHSTTTLDAQWAPYFCRALTLAEADLIVQQLHVAIIQALSSSADHRHPALGDDPEHGSVQVGADEPGTELIDLVELWDRLGWTYSNQSKQVGHCQTQKANQVWIGWFSKVVQRATECLQVLEDDDEADGGHINGHDQATSFAEVQRLNDSANRVMQLASEAIANLCGKTASGPVTRQFSVGGVTIAIREPAFAEVDLGYKTWGASFLLADQIVRGAIDIRGKRVLELGAGTGLGGLVCALQGARHVCLTDYHDKIIRNLDHNLALNNVQSIASATCLDWSWFASDPKMTECQALIRAAGLFAEPFDVIVAADIIYELEHTRWIARLVHHVLQARRQASMAATAEEPTFYIMSPLRHSHSQEMATWNVAMAQQGHCRLARTELVANQAYGDAAAQYQLQQWVLMA